jgi:WD40 repeat protein
MFVWSTVTGVLLAVCVSASAQTPIFVPQGGHSKSVNAIAFNRSGTLLGSAGLDGRLVLWDISSGMMFASIDVPLSSGGHAIGFASNDQLVFIFTDMGARAFEVSSGALKWQRREAQALFAASSASAENDYSRTTSFASLSVRSPRKTGCRSWSSIVHSVNLIWPTSTGSTQ